MNLKRLAVCVAASVVAAACTQPPPQATTPDGTGDRRTPPPSNEQSDWAAILRLEEEAKALVKATGCTAGDQCRTAPVGSRACGGPRYYLVYCSRTTDSVALFRKLAEVESAERAYNAKYQIGSTCEFRMPPTVGVTAGACQQQ
ncbi:MAG TPA: hypothetical protein VFS56_07645 [Gemmatimonadaceae bacterium]|nr:hypothetical protein [Gemmatimonadaceae bacterium]